MTIRGFVMYLAIAGGLAACTTASPEPNDEEQQSDITTVTVPPELSVTPPITNAAACIGEVTCPPEFNNCTPIGDFDCGEEFCRVPGAQCNAQLSTFIRVQHVFQCLDSVGNQCISLTLGRRLVHCGC
jgi:hypothetical protein